MWRAEKLEFSYRFRCNADQEREGGTSRAENTVRRTRSGRTTRPAPHFSVSARGPWRGRPRRGNFCFSGETLSRHRRDVSQTASRPHILSFCPFPFPRFKGHTGQLNHHPPPATIACAQLSLIPSPPDKSGEGVCEAKEDATPPTFSLGYSVPPKPIYQRASKGYKVREGGDLGTQATPSSQK